MFAHPYLLSFHCCDARNCSFIHFRGLKILLKLWDYGSGNGKVVVTRVLLLAVPTECDGTEWSKVCEVFVVDVGLD